MNVLSFLDCRWHVCRWYWSLCNRNFKWCIRWLNLYYYCGSGRWLKLIVWRWWVWNSIWRRQKCYSIVRSRYRDSRWWGWLQ